MHLPIRFDWTLLATTFWLVLAAQSIFVAVLLTFIGFPVTTFAPVLQRMRRDKSRMVLVLAYFLILWWSFTWVKALVLTVDTIALIELRERLNPRDLGKAVTAVFWPALYLFAGFLLIFAYNDVIVSLRFNFTNDVTFNAIDRWLLHGTAVSDLSHWAIRTFPISFFYFLEFIYFGMFTQVGAALILTSLCYGKSRGLQFVGSVLTAYGVTLIIFYAWPSQGPYYLCAEHFSRFPSTLQAYTIEKVLIAKALARWNHEALSRISTDYFVAFPCMHITQPLIVMWFLRRWKRIVVVLAAYDVLLVLAIILLEWHYFVDILAAVPVAGIAIAFTDWTAFRDIWSATKTKSIQAQQAAISL